jgi:hypothetical protein
VFTYKNGPRSNLQDYKILPDTWTNTTILMPHFIATARDIQMFQTKNLCRWPFFGRGHILGLGHLSDYWEALQQAGRQAYIQGPAKSINWPPAPSILMPCRYNIWGRRDCAKLFASRSPKTNLVCVHCVPMQCIKMCWTHCYGTGTAMNR